VVSAGRFDTPLLWPLKAGQAFLAVQGRRKRAVDWSQDGHLIASTEGGMVSFWQAQSGELLKTLSGERKYAGDCVAFSPDGRIIASTGRGDVMLWKTESGEELRTLSGHTDTVMWVTWSPDGKMLATSSQDRTIRLWNAKSGETLQTLPDSHVRGQVFSPDSRTLVYSKGSPGHGGTVHLLDIETGQEKETLPVLALSLAWSPNNRILAVSEFSGVVRTWDLDAGESSMQCAVHTDGEMASLAWSPHGRVLASGSLDGTIRLWDANIGQALGVLVPLGSDQAVIINSDGHYRGSTRVEQNLVYVVQTDSSQETLTPEEFAERYGWKNDPSKVECPPSESN
jgi:WD40 repeat protein